MVGAQKYGRLEALHRLAWGEAMSWHFCIDNPEKGALELCVGSIDHGTGCGCGDLYGYCDSIDGGGWGAGYGWDSGQGIGVGYGYVNGDGLADDYSDYNGAGGSPQVWQ